MHACAMDLEVHRFPLTAPLLYYSSNPGVSQCVPAHSIMMNGSGARSQCPSARKHGAP